MLKYNSPVRCFWLVPGATLAEVTPREFRALHAGLYARTPKRFGPWDPRSRQEWERHLREQRAFLGAVPLAEAVPLTVYHPQANTPSAEEQ